MNCRVDFSWAEAGVGGGLQKNVQTGLELGGRGIASLFLPATLREGGSYAECLCGKAEVAAGQARQQWESWESWSPRTSPPKLPSSPLRPSSSKRLLFGHQGGARSAQRHWVRGHWGQGPSLRLTNFFLWFLLWYLLAIMKPHLKGSHPWDPPGGRHGNPLQYSCLENPVDREAWRATAYGVKKSWTQLKQLSMHARATKYIIFKTHNTKNSPCSNNFSTFTTYTSITLRLLWKYWKYYAAVVTARKWGASVRYSVMSDSLWPLPDSAFEWLHIGRLKSATVEVFTLCQSAKAINRGLKILFYWLPRCSNMVETI